MLLHGHFGELGRRTVQTAGGRYPALLDRVMAVSPQCDKEVVPFDVGKIEPRDPFDGFQRSFQRQLQGAGQGSYGGPGRRLVKPPDADIDGVHGSAPDCGHYKVAGLFQPQASLQCRPVERSQLYGVLTAEKVRGMQEVHVQGVALDPLATVQETTQLLHLGADSGPESVLDGGARRHLVGNRANAADAGRNVGDLLVAPPGQEGLEKPWRLENVERHFCHRTVLHYDAEPTLALQPGQGADIERVVAVMCHGRRSLLRTRARRR